MFASHSVAEKVGFFACNCWIFQYNGTVIERENHIMAYMSQERKAKIAPNVKAILKRYGVKGTLATDRSTLKLNIKSGSLDFIGDFNDTVSKDPYRTSYWAPAKDYLDVNPYHYDKHFSNKMIRKFLDEVLRAMNDGNHDNSDIQTDYFDVGWYVRVNIGKWNKPYILEK